MMNEEYIKRLDFDSDTFEAMKTDMNFILQRMIGSMIEKDSTEGSMTIKIEEARQDVIAHYPDAVEQEAAE